MSVVLMSTNYKGQIFVSRAVARATPFLHHSDQNLEAIKLEDVESSLRSDYERETKFLCGEMAGNGGKFWMGDNAEHFLCHLHADDVSKDAHYIVRNTNNNPRGKAAWGAEDGYTRDGDRIKETLTNAKLQSSIEDGLRNNKSNTFVNESNEPYDFWSSTRFGPMSSDAES